jgi:hypothetical protein
VYAEAGLRTGRFRKTQKTPILGMSQTLLEKLQLADEKNLLIQGLPSSIEKQFSKLSFAKNVTPLLKSRKIDFCISICRERKSA